MNIIQDAKNEYANLVNQELAAKSRRREILGRQRAIRQELPDTLDPARAGDLRAEAGALAGELEILDGRLARLVPAIRMAGDRADLAEVRVSNMRQALARAEHELDQAQDHLRQVETARACAMRSVELRRAEIDQIRADLAGALGEEPGG